ncbi:MAG: DUF4446 family protein [Actinomycetota bacterium]|nr:DUF4446 family protein [Actinomycetota bacterium]
MPALALDPTVVAYVALGAAALGLLGLVLAAATSVQLRRMRASYALHTQTGGEDFVSTLSRKIEEVSRLRNEVTKTRRQLEQTRRHLAASLRHVAVVRYDALNNGRGRLSFSAALLDDGGNGVVLTSIHGRAESRTYAKAVIAGASDSQLSPEEEQTISVAMRPRAEQQESKKVDTPTAIPAR